MRELCTKGCATRRHGKARRLKRTALLGFDSDVSSSAFLSKLSMMLAIVPL
jgi:hypothetical protein